MNGVIDDAHLFFCRMDLRDFCAANDCGPPATQPTAAAPPLPPRDMVDTISYFGHTAIDGFVFGVGFLLAVCLLCIILRCIFGTRRRRQLIPPMDPPSGELIIRYEEEQEDF